MSTWINMNDLIKASGLEDVEAATTRLSDVDGERGRLIIADRPVEELAGEATFEEATFLLFHGREATEAEAEAVRRDLGAARESAFGMLDDVGDALAMDDPMDALRAATAHLPSTSGEAPFAEALRIAGAVATFAAAWKKAAPTRPDPDLGHAADVLRMTSGQAPTAPMVAALDAYLVTVMDHGMNASTFAARVVASTASDTISAVVAALGALKGKLHGGAPGPVLDMLDAVARTEAADPDDAATQWVLATLERGERIMGMGHRVYRVRDPRAFVLERAIRTLSAASVDSAVTRRLGLARAVEGAAERILAARHPDRPLKANVEFYTAVVLEAVGLPRALFTPTFACARVIGWCAHVDEQRRTGRLIRPRSRYVRPT